MRTHYLLGGLLENLIINEVMKLFYNHGKRPPHYYWCESNGMEVDLLIEKGGKVCPLKIKASQTIKRTAQKGGKKFEEIYPHSLPDYVVYGEDSSLGHYSSWQELDTILAQIGIF